MSEVSLLQSVGVGEAIVFHLLCQLVVKMVGELIDWAVATTSKECEVCVLL